MRWVPHDIESPAGGSKKEKDRPRRSLLGRRASEPDHGALKRRKSVISLTSVVDEELDARTHLQAQSMFFAMLPIEIRKMVYEYVVGQETIHLLFAKKRFGHFVCERSGEEDGDAGEYSEAATHVYAPHTFSLLNITHLLYLPSRTPQPRLNTIRTLRLKWTIRGMPYFRRRPSSKNPAYPEDTANWEKGWDILARMKGLRDLRVTIVDPSPDQLWEGHWLGVEGTLLEAVKRVRGVRRFEVVLPYASCRVDWDMGDSGVRLVKPVEDESEGNAD
ncbi:hypothetical protein N0V90_001117 [Kalmusia sp. IMI 367209]|nr:hypothetical protein N0V90_001117 [Kalmusia sp. IMI 367209]